MGLCLSKDAAAAAAAVTTPEAAQAWFVSAANQDKEGGARQRLFCLPWEGGSSLGFNHWQVPFTEVVAVELPGRMGRMKEQPLTRVEAIVRPLAQAMAVMGYIPGDAGSSSGNPHREEAKPVVLFGHSYLGALLAVELARVLVREYGVMPQAVIVSGCPAPHTLAAHYPTRLSALKPDKLTQYLLDTGAITPSVAANKETTKGLLPLYKADLKAVDAAAAQYATAPAPAAPFLSCPILALSGGATAADAALAPKEGMEAWASYTSGSFRHEAGMSPSTDHYANLRKGATDDLVRAVTQATLGRAILMKDVTAARKWFVIPYPRPEAKYRMVCLAWAGGNSSLFKAWRVPDVEVVALELPGRNARAKEAPLKNLLQIVQRTVQAMEVLGYVQDGEKPLILFGHSFGAMQTLEIARLLRQRGHPLPHYLILSGCPPSGSETAWGDTGVSSKTDDGICKYLVWLGGLTQELADNKEIMDKVLPTIRGDYTAIDTYKYTEDPPLDTNVLALTGENDIAADAPSMKGWGAFVVDPTKQFQQVIFGGGDHFYIKDKTELVLKVIEDVAVLGKPAEAKV